MTAALERFAALVASAIFSFALVALRAFLRCLPPLSSGSLAKLQRAARAVAPFRRSLSAVPRRSLWCHVASAGELEEVLPVLDRLRAEAPERAIVLTCFSASGLAAAEREAKKRKVPWDLAGPLPADLPWVSRRFVRSMAPDRALFVHRELWPWHLRALDRERVPTALVQVRAERAGRSWKVLAPWLERFALVGTVDEPSSRAMRALLPAMRAPIVVLGDARIDRIAQRLASVPSGSGDFLVLASVWPEDVHALAPAFGSAELRSWPLVVVPHEPEPVFLEAIAARLREAGWAVRHAPPKAPLVAGEAEIVGTVGGLAERYADASVAFVGGSFRARVHNVLEPAAAGCAVVTGPLTANAPDARALEREGGLRHVADAAAFRAVLADWEDPAKLARARDAARGYVERRRGAGERTARALVEAWREMPL